MKYVALLLVALLFYGCTGRVQTNPIPEQNVFYIPQEYEILLEHGIPKETLREFELYVKKTLVLPREEKKNIWELEIERNFR